MVKTFLERSKYFSILSQINIIRYQINIFFSHIIVKTWHDWVIYCKSKSSIYHAEHENYLIIVQLSYFTYRMKAGSPRQVNYWHISSLAIWKKMW